RPVEPRVEPARPDLNPHQCGQQDTEDRGADQIAVHSRSSGVGRRLAKPGHADGVAAGLAERGGEDLDDPEAQRDRGNLRGFNEVGAGHAVAPWALGLAMTGGRGSSIVAESPGSASRNTSRPPCNSATARTRLRPRPNPAVLRLLSSRLNR